MARRYYSSTARRTTLASDINSSVTSLTVAAVSGWPSSFPYTLCIDEGTLSEELVEVTARSGTTVTVTRGVDGSSAVAHTAGATVNHAVSARDFNEPNQFLNEGGTVTGQTVVSSSGSGTTLEVRNTGTGNSFVVEDSANPDSTPFVVDASGRVGIGTSSPSTANPDASLDVYRSTESNLLVRGDANTQVSVRRSSTDGSGANLNLDKARGTDASKSVVSSGDTIGRVHFRGYDGSAFQSAADIFVSVDGTPGASDMPGAMIFRTTPDGSATLTERMRITSAGNVGIGVSAPGQNLVIGTDTQVSLANGTNGLRSDGTLELMLPSGGTQGDGQLGPGISFGRINSGRRGAVIASVQTSTDADQTGLLFAVRNGTATTNDELLEAVRITHAGYVGIGTSSPGYPLDVVSNSATQGIRLRGRSSDNVGVFEFRDNASTATQAAFSTYPTYLSILVPATERMRIDNAGLITGSGTSLGAWTAYTPTLTASTTNPTLGTGSTASGAYVQIGKVVHFRARIEFGTSGMAAGTGDYYVSLPVTAWSGYPASFPIGYVVIQDQSTGTRYNGLAVINSTTTVRLDMSSTNANSIAAADASPMAWAASDDIWINGTYEIA